MPEVKQSPWEWLLSGSQHQEGEEKVLEYFIYRVGEGANLKEILAQEYVHRNASEDEGGKIINDPRLVHACRERFEPSFESGELDPRWWGRDELLYIQPPVCQHGTLIALWTGKRSSSFKSNHEDARLEEKG